MNTDELHTITISDHNLGKMRKTYFWTSNIDFVNFTMLGQDISNKSFRDEISIHSIKFYKF